jgi:decaprenylphospho-beta-D-ribofuranose 2-oxidase
MKINSYILLLLITAPMRAIDVTDFGKLYPTKVEEIVYPTTVKQIQNIIKKAHKTNKKISIAGARHSQGGQSNASNSINIDISKFNKLIDLDVPNKIVKVQSGMTWEQLQEILHPHNLSIAVMQASNIFSIGGSASVNVHGRDPSWGPIIESIKSITLINDKGEIILADRDHNFELFSLAIGGYGLFGFIAEIELLVQNNCICQKEQKSMDYKEYPKYLKNKVLVNKKLELHYARLNTTPGKHFLKELLSFEYIDKKMALKPTILPTEKDIEFNQYILTLYRMYWGKITNSVRWLVEKYFSNPWEKVETLTRNHAMRPYIHALQNVPEGYTDLLQEYFIPLDKFEYFIKNLRDLAITYQIKLMNVTLRWTPKNTESFLSYAQKDTIALVLYFTAQLTEKELSEIKSFSLKITDICLNCGGTFYLPYQRFATKKQLLKAYPQLPKFIEKKKEYDPLGLFASNWYQYYLLPALSI